MERCLTGLRRAWADVWPPALLVLGILLVSRSGALAVAGGSTAALLWLRGDTRYQELARYVLGFLLFVTLRRLADDFAPPAHIGYPIAMDRALFGEVPAVWLQGHRTPWLDALAVVVYLSYFLIPPAVLALCWRVWPHQLRRYVSATLALFAVSVSVHLFLPTAPPWIAARLGELPDVIPLVPVWFGDTPPDIYQYGLGLSGNLVAAMPSVHLGVTALILSALWRTPLRWAALCYLAAMAWAICYTGDHYLVDGVAGVLLGLVCWRFARYPETARPIR
jgi:membrane-associated phospholipid phosphatase